MLKLQLLLGSALLLSFSAQANSYWAIEAGQSQSNIDVSHFQDFNQSIINSGGSAQLSQDASNTAFIIKLGYQYSPYLSVEVGYLNLGKASATSTTIDTSTSEITRTRIISESVEQKGIMFSVKGGHILNNHWSLNGNLGLAWVSQNTEALASGKSVNAVGSVVATEAEQSNARNSQWAPILGAGVGYQLNSDWQLQLNWKRLFNLDPGVLGRQDANLITLGLQRPF